MRTYCICALFLSVLVFYPTKEAYSFDLMGIQPVAPNGVFSTFSAESLPKYKYAFEIGAESSIDPDFYRFALRGAFGVTDSVQFNLLVPYVYDFHDSIDGFEDLSFGIKHRFYREGKYGPALAYLIHASVPSGRDELSSEGKYGIGLIASKRIAPFKAHVNILYSYPGTSDLEDEVILAAGIELSAGHNYSILSEIVAKKSHFEKEYNQIEARLGYRIKTKDRIFTTLGVGFDLKNRGPEYRIMLSVSFVTPHEKKEIKKLYEEE
jgi:hypothetical protein